MFGCLCVSVMDSQVRRCGRLMDIVNQEWLDDRLPDEDILVPQIELPELEPENGNNQETLKEQEQKWTDLGLSQMQEQQTLSASGATATSTAMSTAGGGN